MLITAVALDLVIIDLSFADDADTLDGGTAWLLEQGRRIPRALFIAAFISCIRVPGETGPNTYGPEFGETDDTV